MPDAVKTVYKVNRTPACASVKCSQVTTVESLEDPLKVTQWGGQLHEHDYSCVSHVNLNLAKCVALFSHMTSGEWPILYDRDMSIT